MMKAVRASALLCVAVAAHAMAAPIPAITNSIFSPASFPSLGDLRPVSNVVFDTSDLTLTIDGAPAGTGTNGISQSGNVQMAVFTFGSISLSSNVSVTVTGNQGLALLAMGSAVIGTTISVSGAPNSGGTGGAGGPGAEGGARQASFSSAPPGPNRGYGGNVLQNGVGYGAGTPDINAAVGSGGGYGGKGGSRTYDYLAGTNYPGTDPTLSDLFGGSGGGGSGRSNGMGSGGGGGALQIATRRTLHVTATGVLQAKGGNATTVSGYYGGGGGSGGGILLAAREILLDGMVSVSGGDTTYTGVGAAPAGGPGGGGRVAFYADEAWLSWSQGPDYTNHPPNAVIRAGIVIQSQTAIDPAESGTFYAAEAPEGLVTKLGTVITVY